MNTRFGTALGALIVVLGCAHVLSAPQENSVTFAPQLLSIEHLAQFRPVIRVGAFGDYDPNGSNDDGFSGKYSFIRKEGDRLVIAEVFGAGAITRIYAARPFEDTTPTEFYFDGEAMPRLVVPFRELFGGKTPPFNNELSGSGLGGYWTYVPLEFEKSVKVVVRAKEFHFYMVNYVVYEPGVRVRSYRPGDRFHFPTLPGGGHKMRATHSLVPGHSVTLFDRRKPGRILALRLGPAEAFAGDDRAVRLRIFWDQGTRPAVDVPVGDFFGYSFGQPATRALLLGTDDGWNYVRFPMPFAHAARIELVSDRKGGKPITAQSEITVSDTGKAPDEGTFHAEWRRENPTTTGKPFTYVDVEGRGQLVGITLQAQGLEPSPMPGHTPFFEGDDEATIDGQMRIHGGGSEESLGGGWYEIPGRWDRRGSQGFYGCLDYFNYLERTGGYRLFVPDAYTFHHHLRYTIEHAPEKNDIPTDYTGMTYYYLDSPEGTERELGGVTARAVRNPDHFVLTFAPSPPPIEALTMASVQLTGQLSGNEWINALHFTRDLSGLPSREIARQLNPGMDLPDGNFPVADSPTFDTMSGPPQLVLSLQIPVTGDYVLSVDGFVGPDQAMLQLRQNDDPVGQALDFYAPEPGRSGTRELAKIHLLRGKNLLYLSLPGRNPKSSGAGVSLIRLNGVIAP